MNYFVALRASYFHFLWLLLPCFDLKLSVLSAPSNASIISSRQVSVSFFSPSLFFLRITQALTTLILKIISHDIWLETLTHFFGALRSNMARLYHTFIFLDAFHFAAHTLTSIFFNNRPVTFSWLPPLLTLSAPQTYVLCYGMYSTKTILMTSFVMNVKMAKILTCNKLLKSIKSFNFG